MANIREIKTRMNSIEDTLKITNAMYLISSSKLKKARKQLDATTPYFEMLQASLLDIMAHTPDLQHIFLNKRKKEHPKKGYLVMTADRGLAGAYNHNITKMAEENINEDDKLFVIGYMGRNYFGRRNAAQMDEDFQPVVRLDAHRVEGVGDLEDRPVDGGVDRPVGRVDGDAVPEHLFRKDRVGDLGYGDHLPGQRGRDFKLFAFQKVQHTLFSLYCCPLPGLLMMQDIPLRHSGEGYPKDGYGFIRGTSSSRRRAAPPSCRR